MDYNDLDLNLIKIFIKVYENKSILAASKKLYVSQPAITSSIKKLEDFLGGQLFVRTSKGVVPTTEGIQFYESCTTALNTIKNGIAKFNDYQTLEKGNLNIGSSSTIVRKIILPFISEFSKKHPNRVLSITDITSDKLMEYTKRGDLDLAILNAPLDSDDSFNVTKVIQTIDCFITNVNFPHNYLPKEEIKNYPLVLQKRPSTNREFFEQMCMQNNINLSPNLEIGSFGLITDFIEKGMGIAYTVKDFVTKDIQDKRVKELKTDFVIKPRDVIVITPQNSVNSFACKTFISELVAFFK